MSFLKYSRCTHLILVLMASGLFACGGGGSGGKSSATSSMVTVSSTAPVLSSVAPASSSSSLASSTPAPDPVLVTSLTLGAPTTNPIVIPPSATAVPVKFLSVVRGNYYPEQLLLDELDKDGRVVRAGVAVLKDDGSHGDAFRGDQIYSGQVLLGSVASLEKTYRVHADHKGKDVTSGIGRFWVSGCPSVARPSNPDKAVLDISSNAYVFADEVLVTLADTVAPELSEINALMAEAKGQVVGCIPALNQYLVELSDSSTAASLYAAIATLKSKTPQVLDASPNAVVLSPPSENAIACDGQECQWYLERIRAPEAWALVGGGDKQMSVGVIDFGVDCTHTDLNCNGSANSEDKIDHGTGVASLIAAHKGDGTAMVGVAWNTALYPFSFIGRGGSQYKMSELITLSMAEESIRVINISAATATDPSNQIRDAMCSAIDSGRLIVAAAGNASTANSCQLEKVYPARYNSSGTCANGADLAKGLLVVGAIDADNNLAQWENNSLCSNTLHVDVFAPGKDIYAASANNNGYAAKNGTSFSSPLVAGSAAVLWAAEPTLTVSQVHDKLVASSVTYAQGTSTGRNQTQDARLDGKQLLDLFAAVGGIDTPQALDLIPDAFAFAERTNAELNTYISSERITVKGIDATVPIAIEGGFYAIDNAPFTSAAGTVGPNQTLVVQLLSANLPLISREVTLTVAGIKQSFKVTTAAMAAAQPSSFNFTDLVNAELGASVLSASLTIAGLTEATPIAIVGGEYAIEGGAFTHANGTVAANQSIQLRVTASTLPDTEVVARVTIGGVSDSFRVTTVPADITPEPFAFADSNNVAPDSLLTSNSISVKGINTEANISVSGGEYAIDGGSYRTAAGKVQAGQTVTLRHKSAAQFATDSYTALTIGGYTATFHSRTSSNTAPTATNITIQDINGGNMEVGDSLLGSYTYVDADNDPEGASHYRWLRNGVVIANETTTTYVLTAADSGQDIRFEVTPVAVGGVIAGSVKESPANPVVNSAPRVTNLLITPTSGVVGDILRASYSYQDAESDLEGQSTYRWLRNGLAIAGATGASYQTLSSDVGQPLSVEITPVALSGKLTGVAVVSNAVLLGNSAPLGKSAAITGAVAGKVAVGATLSGTYIFSDVDGDLEGASGYRWLRNGAAIAGATSRNYLVTAADSGQLIVFEMTPVAATGTVQGAVVLSSAVSVNAVPSAQAVKVVDNNGGSLLVGDALTGTYTYVDAESDAQGSSRFRWLRNGSAISGATAINYVLTSADSAQSIAFEVTPMAAAGSLSGVAVQSVAVSVGNSAPVAANVTIVDSNGGSAMLGDTLSGTYSYSDSDGNSQGATTFNWLRNGSIVSTSQSYTLTAADSGKTLQFKVTPRAMAGVLVGAEASSALLTVPSFNPNSFSFNSVTGAALSSTVTSNTITISGISTATPISIVNGEYAINGGAFTSAAGMVSNGQTLAVKTTASASVNTSVQAVVTVGGVSSSFSVTSVVADTTPDAFSFPQVGNATLGSLVTSAAVTISGINTAAPVSVAGGEYSIDSGAFISTAGTVSNGQTLRVRVTAANALSTTVQAVLTVGGVSSSFSVSTAAADIMPDAFSFPPVSNAALGALVTSAAVTISGINTTAPISISGGEYSINNGAFVSAPGTISNGQTVTVRLTASTTPNVTLQAVLTVGELSRGFLVTTVAADATPDGFSFPQVGNATLGSLVTSAAVTISGINTAAPVSVAGGEYSINNGAFTSAAGTISNGQTLRVRVTAANALSTTVQAVVTVGGVSGAFAVSTSTTDTTPDAFSFASVNNAALSAVMTSNPIAISGINTAATISIVNGQYSINGGAFTSAAATVSNGQTVVVKVTASANPGTIMLGTLNVGGVTGTFAVSTVAADTTPDAFSFTSVTNVALSSAVTSNTITITGINTAAPISIINGHYSINGGAFINTPGTVNAGQTLSIKIVASATRGATQQATLTVGGVTGSFSVTTQASDTTPDGFSFTAVTNAALTSVVISNPVTITGINSSTPISISNGQYSINGGNFISTPSTVSAGQTVNVKIVASGTPNTTLKAVLTVGGVTGSFSVTTLDIDVTPDIFNFTAVTNAQLNIPVTSNEVIISGLTAGTAVAISVGNANGQYSIDGGAFTSANGVVSNGQKVKVRVMSSAAASTMVQTVLTVGNLSSIFRVTTMAIETNPPLVAVLFPPQSSMTDRSSIVLRGTASDTSGIANININGTPAVYDEALSSWQATVPLNPGANTLTVTVTDRQNNQATRTLAARRSSLGDTLNKVRIDAARNRFVALDMEAGLGQLVTIDRANGEVNIVPGGPTSSPRDMRLSADGTRAMVLESPNNIDAIKEINLLTGERKTIAQDTVAEPDGTYKYLYDLAHDPLNKRLFVAGASGLIQVDLTTGVRRQVATVPGINGLAWNATSRRVIINTYSASVMAFNPVDASLQVLSDNTIAVSSSDTNFISLSGIALDEQKNVAYVANYSSGSGIAIVEVNLATGARRLVSDNRLTSEVAFGNGRSYLALDRANNQLLATKQGEGIISVDIASGARKWVMKNTVVYGIEFIPASNTVIAVGQDKLYGFVLGATSPTTISDNTMALADSNTTFVSGYSLVLDPINNLAYVGDLQAASVFTVNLQSAVRKIVSDNSQTGADTTLIDPRSILWLENENRVLVLDTSRRSIIAINTVTNSRSAFSTPFIPSGNNGLGRPIDMLRSPLDGTILVLDKGLPGVISVNPVNGARSIYSNIAKNSETPYITGMAFNSGDNSLLFPNFTSSLRRLNQSLTYETLPAEDLLQVLADGDANSVAALQIKQTPFMLSADTVDLLHPMAELVRINLSTNARTSIAVAPTGNGEVPFAEPVDVALDVAANFTYVVDAKAKAIVRVSLLDGKRTVFASNTIASGLSNINFVDISGIDIDRTRNRLLVSDNKALIAVDLTTASRTLVTNDSVAVATSNVSISSSHVTVDSLGKFAYVFAGAVQGIARVDLVSGERRLISDNTMAVAASNVQFSTMRDVILDEARNRLLVADTGPDSVIAVDLITGARTALTSASSGIYPDALAIDKQSNQVMVLDLFHNQISVVDLVTGARRNLAKSGVQLNRNNVAGIDYNSANNTLVMAEIDRNAVLAVDVKTGEGVVLSQ